MNCCEWCNLSEKDKKYMLFQTEYWQVFLADKQDYIGRCILVCKRHVGALSDLNDEEWFDYKQAVNKLEKAIFDAFGATMYNWSCLMNDFYKSDIPNPHLHIHLRPRYRNPVLINGKVFIDEEFGHHYNNEKTSTVNENDFQRIYSILKKYTSY